MAKAAGLDIGARHVRLVEAEGGARGLKVIRLGEREIQAAEGVDREQAVREAVDALFRDTRASRDEVVLTWPAESCVLREIQVPFREPDQIRKVIKFEFESHLHGRDIDEVVVDFLTTGESREGTRLLCAGADKPPLRARLASLDAVKVDPVAVDLDATCLAAGLAASGVLEETPTSVLVDIGARSTTVLLLAEGRVRSARGFRGGMDTLHLAVERDIGAPAGTGAARALEGGARSDDLMALPGAPGRGDAPPAEQSAEGLEVAVVEDRRADFLGRLSREVTRTLATSGGVAAYPVLFLTGRGSLVPGVRETLAGDLGLEVRLLDLFSRVASPVPPERMEEANATYAAALGAAARALGASPAPLDLRREDLAYARRFDQVKGGIAVTLGLLLLGVGFLLWRAKTEKDVALLEFNAMVTTLSVPADRVETTYKALLGEEQFNRLPKRGADPLGMVPDYNRRATQMSSTLRNEMGISTEVPPITSSLETFRRVHEAIKAVREQLEYCLITTETYNQRGADVTVVLSAPEHVDLVKNAFLEIRSGERALFEVVEPGTVAPDRRGKYAVPFTLSFEKRGGR